MESGMSGEPQKNPDQDTTPTPFELDRLREVSRRSLLRANTAVAVVLALVWSLALAAVWLSFRATRLQRAAVEQQQRAESAESRARSELWRALLAEAKSTRMGPSLTRREAGLETIRRAAAIDPTAELRAEAVATLALPEYRLEASRPIDASVRTMEFDREVRWCALGLTNGDVVVHRVGETQEWRRLTRRSGPIPEAQKMPVLMEFSPDGQSLAVRYEGGALGVWDLAAGSLLFSRDTDQARRPASRARFSADGRWLVAPVFTPDGFAVLDAHTGRIVAHFPEISSFHHAAVRPGSAQFAVYDGTRVQVLDWETRRRVAEFPFPAGARFLAWSPDGRKLAVVGNRLNVHLWDVVDNRVQEFVGHQNHIFRAIFDPSGEHLATMSFDGTTRIWGLPEGRTVGVAANRHLQQWGIDQRSAWSVPGQGLEVRRRVSGGACTQLVGLPDQGDGLTLDVSSDGEWALSLATDSGGRSGAEGLLVWDLQGSSAPAFLPLTNVQSICFQPGRAGVLVARNRELFHYDYLVVTNSGRREFQLGHSHPLPTPPRRSVDRIACSADGRSRAFVDSSSGEVWVEHEGPNPGVVEMREITHHQSLVGSGSAIGSGSVALSPDGRWLACGVDGNRGARVFDARTGSVLATLDTGVGVVQFSPDGRWLVLVGSQACRMFRSGDWVPVWTKPGDPLSVNFSGAAAFSPDGRRLAFARSSTTAALVETESGRELAVLESPAAAPPNTMRWTADGQRIVVGTRANSLDVWQPEVLERELSALGLGWSTRPPGGSLSRRALPEESAPLTRWIDVSLLVAGGGVAVVVLLSLRRHRRLIQDYSRSEAQAQQRERELQVEREVARLKSGFVSTVTHEFRTPLGIIQSSAQILERYLERLSPEERREQTGSITKNVRRMSHLIDEVLVLGQVEAGQMRFEPVPMDLRAFARRLTDEMISATGSACPIELTLGDLPEASGDENLLRHILANLISNAVKYSPAGRTVSWGIEAADRMAIITVRDLGRGIPEADQARLFTAFHRGTNVGEVRGTGLGLKIVSQCVELHGGRIRFESTEGRGTTFIVQLPLFGG